MTAIPNPWHEWRNELSPRTYELGRLIESDDLIDFHDYEGNVLVVVNGERLSAALGRKRDSFAIGLCVTLEGAKRYIAGCACLV